MSKVHEIYIRQWLPRSWSWYEPWRYVAWAHGLTHRVMSSSRALVITSSIASPQPPLALPHLVFFSCPPAGHPTTDGPCPVCPSVLGQPLSRRHM